MVKIKVKKEFTKREFIKYLVEQDNIDVELHDHQIEYSKGNRLDVIKPVISGKFPFGFNHNTKMIELYVEEEITEETKIPELLEIYSYTGRDSINACVYNDESIAEERDADSISFHMINPNGTLTLLWTREGGMVE